MEQQHQQQQQQQQQQQHHWKHHHHHHHQQKCEPQMATTKDVLTKQMTVNYEKQRAQYGLNFYSHQTTRVDLACCDNSSPHSCLCGVGKQIGKDTSSIKRFVNKCNQLFYNYIYNKVNNYQPKQHHTRD